MQSIRHPLSTAETEGEPSASTRIVRFFAMTDRGRKRMRNEDAVCIAPEHGLAAVADGMGGHAHGDVASQLAIETVSTFFRRVVGWDGVGGLDDEVTAQEHCLASAIRLANWRLYYGAEPDPATGVGMGTTLVVALFGEGGHTVTIAHVGDSRAYRLRDGTFERLTEDHSLRQELIRNGANLPDDSFARTPQNLLTRALGITADVDVDLVHEETLPGDVYLLCSDGLWARATDGEIAEVLESQVPLDVACQNLVALANHRGGQDNISVALARVDEIAAPRRSDVITRG